MKYKIALTILVVILMAMSVSAAIPLASGNNVQQNTASMSTSGSFNNSINEHFKDMHNYGARLNYNAKTGNITGRFLTANFNSSTGVFSNITYNMTSTQLISKMYANGTTAFVTSPFTQWFTNNVNVIGNLFMYTNASSFLVMHNNPTIETNMMVYNGTINIYVPTGATIYNTSSNPQVSATANASLNAQANNSIFINSNLALNTMVNFNNTVNAGRQMIIIDNNGTIAMLFLHNGSFKITGHEISISSAKGKPVLVNMVVPPGMQKITDNSTFMHGIMNGIISSEIGLNMVNGTLTNSTLYYNSSLHMVFTGKTSSTESFDVNSSVNHHTIVAIFIGNNVSYLMLKH